jgi:hypothetical protein
MFKMNLKQIQEKLISLVKKKQIIKLFHVFIKVRNILII